MNEFNITENNSTLTLTLTNDMDLQRGDNVENLTASRTACGGEGKFVARNYKRAYESLGDEHEQEGIPEHMTEKERSAFWWSRSDVNWVAIPKKTVYDHRIKGYASFSMVVEVLNKLKPDTTFNPCEVWEAMKKKYAEIRGYAQSAIWGGTAAEIKRKNDLAHQAKVI